MTPSWLSNSNMPSDDELLKAPAARWCPNDNTIHTCYSELGISFVTSLGLLVPPIVDDLYNEFFPGNSIGVDKNVLDALRLLFQKWEGLSNGEKRPQ